MSQFIIFSNGLAETGARRVDEGEKFTVQLDVAGRMDESIIIVDSTTILDKVSLDIGYAENYKHLGTFISTKAGPKWRDAAIKPRAGGLH